MSELEVVRRIHAGRCHDVYLARDAQGNTYALKRFHREELEAQREYRNRGGRLVRRDWREDFDRFLGVQRVVDDDSCIRCFNAAGIDLTQERPLVRNYIDLVFEFAECGSLVESLSDPVPEYPEEVIRCIARDIFSALKYLLDMNIAHLDIKPNNIFMNKHGRAKLGDFGESEFMEDGGKVRAGRGNWYFQPPETFDPNSERTGNAVDMWAFGITLWILYFRRLPFSPTKNTFETIEAVKRFVAKRELRKLRDEGVVVDEQFEDLLGRMLDRDPKTRIRPNEALEHPWLSDVDREAARRFCRSKSLTDL